VATAAPPDSLDEDEETVDRPADPGGRGGPPELWPPPAFERGPDEPGVTGAEGRASVEIGDVVTVVVTGAGRMGADATVVAVTVGTVTLGTVTPGIVIPGTVTPGTVTPGTVTPGTVTPGTVIPGTDTVGVLTPGTVPALLTCGDATKIDSRAPASRAVIAVGRRAEPSKPLDRDLCELPTGPPVTQLDKPGHRSKPRWVRPRKTRSQSLASWWLERSTRSEIPRDSKPCSRD